MGLQTITLVLRDLYFMVLLWLWSDNDLLVLKWVNGPLNPSVLGHVIFILLNTCQFCTASETHVGIEVVQTLAINLLTSIDPS